MKPSGTGLTLREACPWLRNDTERWAQILEVTERDSVIEGLPPFQDETRRHLMQQFAAMAGAEPSLEPGE